MALVHRWKFENDLNDSVGSSNGSNTNCTFYPNDNINGNYSIYIPKTPTGYPTFPDINIASYTNFTWAFWFRSVISGVQQYLVMDWTYPGAPDERLALVLNTNNRLIIYPYVGGKFGAIYSTTNFNIAAWNHVVLTASGTGSTYYTLYLNGKYDIAGTSSRSTYNTNTFRLGVHSPGVTAAKFDGYMDDFRFYDTALTADEVMNLYKSYATPIWQQPLHRWKLDGDATDSAGNKNGTAYNMTYNAAQKVIGNYSGVFNGSNGYITADGVSPFSYTNYTISIWFKCTNGNRTLLIADRNPYARVVIVMLNDSLLRYQVFVDSTEGLALNLATSVNVADDKWHNYCITDANGTCNHYIDGKSSGTGSYTRYAATQTLFTIGAYRITGYLTGISGYFMTGNLDDIRFYDVALSASDVRALYNSYFTEKATNFMSML